MKLEVLGSGGAVRTPKPFCECPVCSEARSKGGKYTRLGPSVFIHGPDILIDTPEDISHELNRSSVKQIKLCLYSHWHPDHTAGKRIFEMNKDWLNYPPRNRTTKVVLTNKLASTFISRMGIMDHLNFMNSQGLIDLEIIGNGAKYSVNGYAIEPVQLGFDYVFGYVIQGDNKNILIIMDELKNWNPQEGLLAAHFDLVYLPFGIFEINPLNNQRNIAANHPMLEDEHTIEETMGLIGKLDSSLFVLSHIEEPENLTIGEAKQIEEYYSRKSGRNIKVAFDTMIIEI